MAWPDGAAAAAAQTSTPWLVNRHQEPVADGSEPPLMIYRYYNLHSIALTQQQLQHDHAVYVSGTPQPAPDRDPLELLVEFRQLWRSHPAQMRKACSNARPLINRIGLRCLQYGVTCNLSCLPVTKDQEVLGERQSLRLMFRGLPLPSTAERSPDDCAELVWLITQVPRWRMLHCWQWRPPGNVACWGP